MTLESILAWVCAVDGVSLSHREGDTALGTEGYLVLLYSPQGLGFRLDFPPRDKREWSETPLAVWQFIAFWWAWGLPASSWRPDLVVRHVDLQCVAP